jgi:hypothetical protein
LIVKVKKLVFGSLLNEEAHPARIRVGKRQ